VHPASEPRGSAGDRRSARGGPRSCRAARRKEASEAEELVQHAELACVAQRLRGLRAPLPPLPWPGRCSR